MLVPAGNNSVRVTLETPDGRIWTGMAQSMTVAIDSGMPLDITPLSAAGSEVLRGYYDPHWRVALFGRGEMHMLMEENMVDRDEAIQQARTAAEWMCDFCGSVHGRDVRQCQQCGAPRSFVYG